MLFLRYAVFYALTVYCFEIIPSHKFNKGEEYVFLNADALDSIAKSPWSNLLLKKNWHYSSQNPFKKNVFIARLSNDRYELASTVQQGNLGHELHQEKRQNYAKEQLGRLMRSKIYSPAAGLGAVLYTNWNMFVLCYTSALLILQNLIDESYLRKLAYGTQIFQCDDQAKTRIRLYTDLGEHMSLSSQNLTTCYKMPLQRLSSTY